MSSRSHGNGARSRGRSTEPMVVAIDENGAVGESLRRTLAHQAPGVLHLAVSVQVVDVSRGRWLLQRRAGAKALFANRWANTCCTHPAPGEEPVVAALRRLREETGLVLEDLVSAGGFTYRATDDESGLVEYEHDFAFVAVGDIEAVNPDPDEISDLALLPFEQAFHLLESDAGAPWAAEVLRRSSATLSRRRPTGTLLGLSGDAGNRRWTGTPLPRQEDEADEQPAT